MKSSVFSLIQKLYQYSKYAINAKKVWKWPRQSEVLIYDARGERSLLKYLHSWDPEVLHVQNEVINMRVLLHSFFIRGKKLDAYTDCFIKKVKPKLIVTFIDNNPNFYTISQRHVSVKTMFIQNGTRCFYNDVFELLDKSSNKALKLMTVDYMMIHGSNVGGEFARYIKGKVIPVGSLLNNSIPKYHSRQSDVVAFVSQWRKDGFSLNGIFHTHESFFRQVDKPIIEFLVKYTHEKNKQLMVIPYNHKDDSHRADEEAYFRSLVGDNVVFLEPTGPYSSYQALDIAGVVVGVDSTLVFEALARGARGAVFPIRSSLLGLKGYTYGWPVEYSDVGPFWTSHLSIEIFERIMDHLFEIDDGQWQTELVLNSYDNVITNDPENKILMSILSQELNSMS